jgi:hypothetical protein
VRKEQTPVLKLLVDFNDVRDGLARGLMEDASGERPLRVGDHVLLHDAGEHEAWGDVRAVERELVRVSVDWATWGPPRPRETQPLGWWAPPTEVHRAESPPDLVEIFSPRTIAYGANEGVPQPGRNTTGPKPAHPVRS